MLVSTTVVSTRAFCVPPRPPPSIRARLRPQQLRYDLRKLKGHGLIERDGSRYAYRLTMKGVQVALLFLFFHKRLCGPVANSCFHHQADLKHRPHSQLEAASLTKPSKRSSMCLLLRNIAAIFLNCSCQ
jgi:hypothetical protein